MANDQIGLDVRPRCERVEDRLGFPDRVLKRPAAKMILLGGTPPLPVLHDLNGPVAPRRAFRDEGTAITVVACQAMREMAELRRIVRMKEENVHGRARSFGKLMLTQLVGH